MECSGRHGVHRRNRPQAPRPVRRPVRRGDNIPPVSDYAHWNEDAQRIWWEENRYDIEHADEIIEDTEETP